MSVLLSSGVYCRTCGITFHGRPLRRLADRRSSLIWNK